MSTSGRSFMRALFGAYCAAFAEPAMSAKDSFKAQRKTGDSRLSRELSKTLRQGDTQWAFSTKSQQHSQSDNQPSRNAGRGSTLSQRQPSAAWWRLPKLATL